MATGSATGSRVLSTRMVPLDYTATILLLYTAHDLSSGTGNILARVGRNLVGIAVSVFVAVYLFPLITKEINPRTTITR